MKDFDYEVLQRKRLAQQARHKRNGSKSRKCSLPSDGLTQKQWKERNGEVMTYNLSRPMDWETFEALPVDIQGEYIAKLCKEHGGTIQRLIKMFGVGPARFKTHLKQAGIKQEFSAARHPVAVEQARKEAWERFIAPEPEEEAAPEPEEAPPIEEEQKRWLEEAAEKNRAAYKTYALGEWGKPTMSFDSFTLCFSGPFDREALCNSLAAILQNGQRVKLEIKCEMEGD